MTKSTVRISKSKLPEFLKAVKALTSKEVLVGIPADKADRSDGEQINNAQLGYIHETGSPSRNIPARPWLVPGIKSVQGDIRKAMFQMGKAALTSDKPVDAVDKGLTAMGLMAQAAVKNKLVNGPFIPLAPLTIAKRKARGVTRENPLIDTGKMMAAVNFVIRPKSK